MINNFFAAMPKEPQSYKEAMSRSDVQRWGDAMKAQMNFLEENKTWIVVKRSTIPKNKTILQKRWVYVIK
jgi:hypothetical protein